MINKLRPRFASKFVVNVPTAGKDFSAEENHVASLLRNNLDSFIRFSPLKRDEYATFAIETKEGETALDEHIRRLETTFPSAIVAEVDSFGST